ncbi:hypothetical protein [Jeotgalibacillus proteolyticus]|uniref:HEAT repeat domain-containing protein n=1 Tax=Jeotgalibacillus proteolyticus TaxID=2082395 RepID=A0A2S5GDE2_9BACL|nr:hypothetical protein [Jeotgalibacillus proteolyticus]PPA71009.1 hypothetical protein C4B60_09520 [Jeotgalibacillus proteolyticus]
MDQTVKIYFKNLESKDKQLQFEAYTNLMEITTEKVDWAYEVWDKLKADLTHKDPHKRSRAAQFLAHLALSDFEKRMLEDFSDVWKVTQDEKFVTARHSLQSIWRVALAGEGQKELVLSHLIDRFKNCLNEKNYTLIRFDIIESFKKLYNASGEEEVKTTAFQLIELEEDSKYKKKYTALWK